MTGPTTDVQVQFDAFRAQVLAEFARYANKHEFTGTHKPMNRLGFTDEEIETARTNDAAATPAA